jgi:membrane protein implicated in regulation of membrane protease activity
MTRKIIRTVGTALILGAAIFFMPMFILKLAVFFIVISSLFRIFIWRMFRRIARNLNERFSADNITGGHAYERAGWDFKTRNDSNVKRVIIIK